MTPSHALLPRHVEQNETQSVDFHFDVPYALDADVGLNRSTVGHISAAKSEDPWPRAVRL
jgi:hypothetical protein